MQVDRYILANMYTLPWWYESKSWWWFRSIYPSELEAWYQGSRTLGLEQLSFYVKHQWFRSLLVAVLVIYIYILFFTVTIIHIFWGLSISKWQSARFFVCNATWGDDLGWEPLGAAGACAQLLSMDSQGTPGDTTLRWVDCQWKSTGVRKKSYGTDVVGGEIVLRVCHACVDTYVYIGILVYLQVELLADWLFMFGN